MPVVDGVKKTCRLPREDLSNVQVTAVLGPDAIVLRRSKSRFDQTAMKRFEIV